MATIEKEEKESSHCCNIDKDLVAYKIHYFLLSGAHVGVIPYLPVYAKTTLGCSATTVGILATCMQFSTTISKPMFGLLADCLNQMKILIATLLVIEVLLSLLMLTLPPVSISNSGSTLPNDSRTLLRIAPARVLDTSVSLHSPPKSHHPIPNGPQRGWHSWKVMNKKPFNYTSSHISQDLGQSNGSQFSTSHQWFRSSQEHNSKCKLNCDSLIIKAICHQNISMCIGNEMNNLLTCKLSQRSMAPSCEGFQKNSNFTLAYDIKDNSNAKTLQTFDLIPHSLIFYHVSNLTEKDYCNVTSTSCRLHCEQSLRFCTGNQADETSIYKTYQFWIFCLFALLGAMCQGAVYTLSDTVCYERLRGTTANFGRQRLWAAVGWGAIAPVTGYLNDLVTGPSMQEDYTSGWYIMTILSFCFLINLYCMKFPKTKKSSSICKDMKGVLCRRQFVLMEVNVFFVGVLTAYTTNYVMWYMETLGSNSMQMGLALAVACLLGDVPFMYFSGWLISKLGHWHIVTLTFIAFAARFGAYYMLVNSWMVLPVELIDGITFGLFYTAMTSYGEVMATPGTEATIQGILGGTYQGLGSGVGCLIAGISFDKFGGRRSFLLVSIVGACLTLCHAALFLICKPQKKRSDDLIDSFKAQI